MTAQDDQKIGENIYGTDPLTTSNIKTLLAWRSPSRPWKKRGKQFHISTFSIAALISVILFLFGEYVLIVTVFTLTFVAVVLAAISPHDILYRITTQGVTIGEHTYLWKELYDFYFKKQFGEDVLYVRTHALIPGEIVMTLGTVTKEHAREVMVAYLPFRESVERSFIEKSGDWLARTFPLDQ